MESNKKDVMDHQDIQDRELVTRRVIHAPRELVFAFWTNPDHIKNWWGPNGFSNTIYTMDVRPGGHWDFVMHGPDGIDYRNKSVFVEIVKPERIVFQHMEPIHKFQVTATFEDLGESTNLTFQMLFESAAECEKVKVYVIGANEQNFDRLETYMSKILNKKK